MSEDEFPAVIIHTRYCKHITLSTSIYEFIYSVLTSRGTIKFNAAEKQQHRWKLSVSNSY